MHVSTVGAILGQNGSFESWWFWSRNRSPWSHAFWHVETCMHKVFFLGFVLSHMQSPMLECSKVKVGFAGKVPLWAEIVLLSKPLGKSLCIRQSAWNAHDITAVATSITRTNLARCCADFGSSNSILQALTPNISAFDHCDCRSGQIMPLHWNDITLVGTPIKRRNLERCRADFVIGNPSAHPVMDSVFWIRGYYTHLLRRFGLKLKGLMAQRNTGIGFGLDPHFFWRASIFPFRWEQAWIHRAWADFIQCLRRGLPMVKVAKGISAPFTNALG